MDQSSFDTVALNDILVRAKAGDDAAWDDLLGRTAARLEQMVHRMIRGFPTVRRWEDTGDVLQNSLLRLIRSLRAVDPGSTRAFYSLAAEQIRRELLDLARHYQGPRGHGRNYGGSIDAASDSSPGIEPPDPASSHEIDEIDRWAAFHTAVEKLPVEEREAFMLTFYHGWSQKQVAELFGVEDRTIRRRYRAAVLSLTEALGGQLPGDAG